MAQTKISGQEKSKILFEIADKYIKEIRRWEPGTYKLQVRGKLGQHNVVVGYLFQDVEAAKKYAEENPNIVITGHYPSEFMLLIDFDKREIIKDIRPGQKEQRPRP